MTTVDMPIEAVRRHASNLDGISADVRTAYSAANEVYLDTDAFGMLCQFLPTVFDPVLRAAVDAIDSTSSSLSQSATSLRTASGNTQATDAASASSIDSTAPGSLNLPL